MWSVLSLPTFHTQPHPHFFITHPTQQHLTPLRDRHFHFSPPPHITYRHCTKTSPFQWQLNTPLPHTSHLKHFSLWHASPKDGHHHNITHYHPHATASTITSPREKQHHLSIISATHRHIRYLSSWHQITSPVTTATSITCLKDEQLTFTSHHPQTQTFSHSYLSDITHSHAVSEPWTSPTHHSFILLQKERIPRSCCNHCPTYI